MSAKSIRLNPSLYDLEQSGKQWAGLLVDTVVEYGMKRCRTHQCVIGTVVDGKVERHQNCRSGRDRKRHPCFVSHDNPNE